MSELEAGRIIEWAVDLLEHHPMKQWTNPQRRLDAAMELARLRVELSIALAAAFGPHEP